MRMGILTLMASRVCWNCEKESHQTVRSEPLREAGPVAAANFWFALFQCDNCGYGSVGQIRLERSQINPNQRTFNQSQVDPYVTQTVKLAIDAPNAPITWLPQHVLGRRFDDVPDWIADAASEAYACYSIRSYRAAILLARSVVEAVAKDKGITNGSLAGKIDALADANHIRPLIQSTAHEIRHLGNDMAHGDFVEPTTDEDAEDVLDFMSVVLAEVYQLPAQVNARQATRAARSAAASARRAEGSPEA
jgi:hypothetical protein